MLSVRAVPSDDTPRPPARPSPTPMPNPTVTAVLLAGGRSRRFGTDKALHPVGERPMARWVYDAVAPLVAEVLVSVRAPGTSPIPEAEEIVDLYPGSGPLAGLHAGLLRCRTPWLLTVACDLPFLTKAGVAAVLAGRGAHGRPVVARAQGGAIQPLCALYPVSLLPTVETALASGQYAMHALLESAVRWEEVVLSGDVLRNVNAPTDLEPEDESRGGAHGSG